MYPRYRLTWSKTPLSNLQVSGYSYIFYTRVRAPDSPLGMGTIQEEATRICKNLTPSQPCLERGKIQHNMNEQAGTEMIHFHRLQNSSSELSVLREETLRSYEFFLRCYPLLLSRESGYWCSIFAGTRGPRRECSQLSRLFYSYGYVFDVLRLSRRMME